MLTEFLSLDVGHDWLLETIGEEERLILRLVSRPIRNQIEERCGGNYVQWKRTLPTVASYLSSFQVRQEKTMTNGPMILFHHQCMESFLNQQQEDKERVQWTIYCSILGQILHLHSTVPFPRVGPVKYEPWSWFLWRFWWSPPRFLHYPIFSPHPHWEAEVCVEVRESWYTSLFPEDYQEVMPILHTSGVQMGICTVPCDCGSGHQKKDYFYSPMMGMHAHSLAYHSDDGCIYYEGKVLEHIGITCEDDYHLRMVINYRHRTIQFHKNDQPMQPSMVLPLEFQTSFFRFGLSFDPFTAVYIPS